MDEYDVSDLNPIFRIHWPLGLVLMVLPSEMKDEGYTNVMFGRWEIPAY